MRQEERCEKIWLRSNLNQSAIALLNSRRRKSRPGSNGTLDLSKAPELVSMPSLNGVPSLKGMPSLTGISGWLQQLGHSVVLNLLPFARKSTDHNCRTPTWMA